MVYWVIDLCDSELRRYLPFDEPSRKYRPRRDAQRCLEPLACLILELSYTITEKNISRLKKIETLRKMRHTQRPGKISLFIHLKSGSADSHVVRSQLLNEDKVQTKNIKMNQDAINRKTRECGVLMHPYSVAWETRVENLGWHLLRDMPKRDAWV